MGHRDRMLLAAVAVAGVAGIGISAYLTVVHYSALQLVCSTSGLISCERVLSSPYAVIAGSGLPTSTAGIIWFSVSALLAAAQLRGLRGAAIVRWHLLWSALGLATVIYLVFLEIVQLGAVCIWCSAAHALVVVTFLIALTRLQTVGVPTGD
jgi:uncharacterized membrane protein